MVHPGPLVTLSILDKLAILAGRLTSAICTDEEKNYRENYLKKADFLVRPTWNSMIAMATSKMVDTVDG